MNRLILLIVAMSILSPVMASNTSLRFGNVQTDCENGFITVDIQVSQLSDKKMSTKNWMGSFTFNDELIDYPTLVEGGLGNKMTLQQNGNEIFFRMDGRKNIIIPSDGEWLTLATIEFEIMSYFPTRSGKGIDLKWKTNSSGTAVNAYSLTSRADMRIYKYEDDVRQITEICPALTANISSFNIGRMQSDVVLKWSTNLEKNNKGFEVQYAKVVTGNLVPEYSKLQWVTSKGNSNTSTEYQILLSNISEGEHLFRIKQIGEDGSFEYSEPQKLIIKPENTPLVPTPTARFSGITPE